MGLIHFQPSRKTDAPEIRNMPVESSATFTIGAPLQRDATNTDQVEVHAGGATVTGIVGVALQAVATAGTPDFGDKVQVAIANKDTEFMGQVISGSTVQTVSDDGTYEGNSYGMVASSSNWYVDAADTSDVVLVVTKELPDVGGAGAVLFKFIDSAIAE